MKFIIILPLMSYKDKNINIILVIMKYFIKYILFLLPIIIITLAELV